MMLTFDLSPSQLRALYETLDEKLREEHGVMLTSPARGKAVIEWWLRTVLANPDRVADLIVEDFDAETFRHLFDRRHLDWTK